MLSKEEKLKYGEALRQQMKEKEEKKRNEDLAKRAVNNVVKSQSDRVIIPDPNLYDQKDVLIKKLETQDYNPFGKAGGGAPNHRQINHSPDTIDQNQSVLQGYSSQEHMPYRHYPPESYNEPSQHYANYDQRNPSQIPTYNRNQPVLRQEQNQSSQPPVYQNSGNGYPNQSIASKERRQIEADPRLIPHLKSYPETYDNPPQMPDRSYQDYPQMPYPQRIQRQPHQNQYNEPQGRSGLYRQDYSQPHLNNEKSLGAQFQIQGGRQRVKTLENQQLQDVYKKGGRNLLRLQNQTVDQHLVKQKQKLEMQAFLKQQMEQAQRRKQEERQKIKREEMEEERRNREYIQRQNQKMQEEERKKVEDKQRLAEENLKSLAIKKELEQEAKLKEEKEGMERRLKQEMEARIQRQNQNNAEKERQYHSRVKRPKEESSQSVSETSSQQNTYSKGFNTNISRDFVKKQREKDAQRSRNDKKLEMFTQEIQKMRDQILDQGQMFQKEIDKIKREAERAQDQKRKAELEIEKLKLELQKKNKESQLRLLQALKRNNPYNQHVAPQQSEREPEQYRQYPPQNSYDAFNQQEDSDYMDRKPYGIPSKHPPSPKKPMSKAKKRVYEHPEDHLERPPLPKKQYNWEKDFEIEQSNIGTLEADSKKIPINIQNGGKLTLSGVDNYGKDSFLYGQSSIKPRRFEQMKAASRGSRRGGEGDELDKLVQNKWEMSAVKDDITDQIEELLKKKDTSGSNKISRAGREILSRGALPYDGPGIGTLNSNKVSLVSDNGTLDVDKIHGRNQARLRQLKALGVETVNTNNDDDLNRLNTLLNNYR